ILERWSGDDSLQVISVHDDFLQDIGAARDEFIADHVKKVRQHKSGNLWQKIQTANAAKDRPGAVGNYYLKFQFSNDPIFVLRKPPDADVRVTAWLTVLTSALAIVLELFPLHVVPPADAQLTFTPTHTASAAQKPEAHH